MSTENAFAEYQIVDPFTLRIVGNDYDDNFF